MLRNPNAPYGGLLSLMALKGRKGDTELVHMSQPQVARLQALGTLSQNPATGLPEARPTAPVSVLSRADGGPLLPRKKPYTSNPQGGPPREVIDDPDFIEEMDRATYVDPLIDYDPKRMGITPSDKWAILGTYVADIDKLSPFNKGEYLNFFRNTDASTLVSDKNNRKDIMGITGVLPENKETVLEIVKHEGRHRGINNLSIDLGEPLKFIFTDKNNKVTKSLYTDEETINRLQDWMNLNKKEQKRNLDFFNEVFQTYDNNKFTKEDITEILKHPKFLNQLMYISQQAQMSRARDIDEGINERGQAWTHYPNTVKRPKAEAVIIKRAGGGNMSSDPDEADIPRIDKYSEPDLVETSPSGARIKYGKFLPVRLEDPVDFRDANILRRLQEGMSEIVERSVPPEARDSVSLVHSYVNPLMWVPDPENLYDKAALVKKGIKENDKEAFTEGLIGLGEDAFSILGAGAGVKALKSAKGAVKRTANKMKRADGGDLNDGGGYADYGGGQAAAPDGSLPGEQSAADAGIYTTAELTAPTPDPYAVGLYQASSPSNFGSVAGARTAVSDYDVAPEQYDTPWGETGLGGKPKDWFERQIEKFEFGLKDRLNNPASTLIDLLTGFTPLGLPNMLAGIFTGHTLGSGLTGLARSISGDTDTRYSPSALGNLLGLNDKYTTSSTPSSQTSSNATATSSAGSRFIDGESGPAQQQEGYAGTFVPPIVYGGYAKGGVLHGDQYHEGMVDGKGDGQSDHVPFGVQGGDTPMALLSRDEYVLPADVVAMIGSGSSNAGAERLDKFVKSVRKESYGTTKQMPAMKDGGIAALMNK